MTRARELANFADDVAGLETLTVSDVTDLSVSASNINSATNQITDSSTDLNVDSNTLVVDKSENKVGIGATAPAEKLHVQGTGNSQLTIRGDEGEDAGFSLVADEGDDNTDWWKTYIDHSDSSKLKIANYSTGSWADKFIIDSSGKVGIGTSSPAEILHLADHGGSTAPAIEFTNSANSRGLEIRATFSGDYASFKTIGSSAGFDFGTDQSGGTSYVRIDNSGNVGIGTTSPSSLLTAKSTSSANLTQTNFYSTGGSLDATTTSDYYFLRYWDESTDYRGARLRVKNAGYSDKGGSIQFQTSKDGTANQWNDGLLIDKSGNVGIGTTGPQCKLNILPGNAVEGVRVSGSSNTLGLTLAYTDAGHTHSYIYNKYSGNDDSDIIFGFGSSYGSGTVMTLKKSGNVGIGNTSPSYRLDVSNSAESVARIHQTNTGGGYNLYFILENDGGGDSYLTMKQGSATGYIKYSDENSMTFQTNGMNNRLIIDSAGNFTGSSSADISDQRFKENIKNLTGSLEKICQLRGISYTWKKEAGKDIDVPYYGLVAQELEKVIPELVWDHSIFDTEEENYKSIHMTGLIPVLLEAVKELSAKVTALESA